MNFWGMLRWLSTASAVAGAVAIHTHDAAACGGCFIAPERVQPVTSHRMVLSIGARETILWDQFRYAGTPSEFAWVLPVTGDARVELASAAFFDALDDATSVTITPPRCNPTSSGVGCGASPPSAAEEGFRADAGVTVLRQESVGPYDTVLLQATGADVLTQWLQANGFAVPGSITATIAHYTAMRANFIALKLRPAANVQQMQPVRVRMQGSSMLLPLRMVSAGITDKVGITLWIFAAGRWEAGNFPNGEVLRSRVAWDWQAQRSDYTDLAESILTANRRTWLTEMSEPASSYVNFTRGRLGQFGRPTINLSAQEQQEAMADFTAAIQGDLSNAWITRLRADLPATMLDRDLEVRAAAENAALPASFTVIRTRGTPPNGCPSLSPTGCTALPVASAGRAIPALPFALTALVLGARKLSRSRRARRPS
ncbi:MAG: DUF2330 domain-containing protein [Polyangiales bacterium]